MSTEALKTLHTAMLDTREGYEVAERNAETPELRSLFGQMIALRTKDHEAIHHALEQEGEKPDEGGSFMAAIHKTMTKVRAATTGLDDDALSPFIQGETSIVADYEKAIEEAGGDAAKRSMLAAQKAALEAKIVEMTTMKAGDRGQANAPGPVAGAPYDKQPEPAQQPS